MTQTLESLLSLLHRLDELHVQAYSIDEFLTMRKLTQRINDLREIAYYVLSISDFQLFMQEFAALAELRSELV